MENIEDVVTEKTTLSMIRMNIFIIVVPTMIGWLFVSLKSMGLVDIPDNILYLNMAAIGGKVWQKFAEKK